VRVAVSRRWEEERRNGAVERVRASKVDSGSCNPMFSVARSIGMRLRLNKE